jgi:hypothetical protein
MSWKIDVVFQSTPEYEKTKNLITEKKQIQARLREVDRQLRALDIFRPGIVALVRKDMGL